MDLTINELQFMTVLWCADTPLTSTEVLKLSVEKTWRDASLHSILNNLLEKGAIAEHGFVKDGKAISRTFVPVLSCEDYYEVFFAGHKTKDIPMILSALMKRSDFDAETIKKLEDIIKERRLETLG
jgi:predicted transcriptional regulator